MIDETHASQARPLWIIAFLILFGGYFTVTARYENRIRGVVAVTQSNYEHTRSNRERIITASRLIAMRNALNVQLKTVRETASPPENLGSLLTDLERKAHANSCQLLDVVPVAAAENVTHRKPLHEKNDVAGALDGLGFDLTIRGGYGNILKYAAQITRGVSLLEVSRIQMNLSAAEQTDAKHPPFLDATFHIILYSLRPSGVEEDIQ